jgi:drug/metabolite transporter superfamily protein YnfA
MNRITQNEEFLQEQLAVSNTTSENTRESSPWTPEGIALTIFLFILAGVFEVGGGYLVWIGVRQKKLPYIMIPAGALVLVCYGFIPTFQPIDSFGRTFAVYGGFFIVLSYFWAYLFDGMILDLGDYIGSAIALVGVCIAWFWPR